MKGPIKMQDKYFKFSQTSFKDVYSLTLRKFLYPWLFPELAETMNNAPGVKLSVEFVPTDPKYSPSLSPECSTQEHGFFFVGLHIFALVCMFVCF